jgi:hypothetical protein
MSVKVRLNVHNPKINFTDSIECEFARIPTVGEHITIPTLEESYMGYAFKVVFVMQIPLTCDVPHREYEYSAEIYALGVGVKEAIEASGFYNR